jgi:hypothetical protein
MDTNMKPTGATFNLCCFKLLYVELFILDTQKNICFQIRSFCAVYMF